MQTLVQRNLEHLTYRPLLGQSALVTGASSGIGRATAICLARAGANVVVNWASGEQKAQETAREVEAFGVQAITARADVSDEDAVLAMFQRAREAFGTIDILVNNAGLQRDAPFDEMSASDFRRVLDVNLVGQFLCARQAVREFKRRGKREGGSRALGKIVCISSVHDVIPWAGHVNYAASKGGIAMLMKSLAQEVAPLGIRVNSVSPGAIRTPINRSAWETPEAYADLMKLVPAKRIGEADDIGRAVVFLASDDADYITGATLYVDGGMTLYPGFEGNG
jgi:glucose 1-dehydrogenase